MPEQDPFISVADLEAILGVDIVDPNSLEVKIALDSACERVRSYLGQTLNLVTNDVEVHSGGGRRKLRLRQRPVRSVSQVKIDGEVIPSTDYNVRGAFITMTDGDLWTWGDDNVEVTYTHGYDLSESSDDNVPPDIRLVALSLANRIYQSLGVAIAVGGITEETIGDYSYRIGDTAGGTSAVELYDSETYLLDRYRIELVGDTPTQWA